MISESNESLSNVGDDHLREQQLDELNIHNMEEETFQTVTENVMPIDKDDDIQMLPPIENLEA